MKFSNVVVSFRAVCLSAPKSHVAVRGRVFTTGEGIARSFHNGDHFPYYTLLPLEMIT